MKYIALLRGINVGGNHKVEMKKLKGYFESLDYTDVSTYINSGNILFSTTKNKSAVQKEINSILKKKFEFTVPALIKTQKEINKIANAAPKNWLNNEKQRTDVAYLFPEVDNKSILSELPMNKDFVEVSYVKGAIIWTIDRQNLNKSCLNKLIGHRLYKSMTIRNINTARYLSEN
jgi:uncharacterized protein (DUF1697 family)